MSGINSVDDFLSHRSTERGAFLSGWKKDGKVDVWLAALPVALWRHGGIPRVVVVEDKLTKENVTRVWSGNWPCHEDESVLKKQYKRDADGQREAVPHYCPFCRLTDVMYHLVTSGRVSWLKPIFKFEGDEPKETVILHAGGMWMARKAYEELDVDQKRAAKDAGISLKDMGWKENVFAKMEYVCRVVDNAHPETGIQIANVTSSLGDKIKDVIVDQREDLGAEEGDPFKNPYAIQWEYREREPVPANMYKARALTKTPLTPAIANLLKGPLPDIGKMVQPFNIPEMRAFLESHALVKLPWDDIFDVKKRPAKSEEPTEPRGSVKAQVPEALEPAPKPSKAVAAKTGRDRAPFPSEDDPHAVACEGKLADGTECEKPIWDDATTCPHCGAEYDESGKLKPRVVEPRKMRKRGEVPAPAESSKEVVPVKPAAKAAPTEMEDLSAPLPKAGKPAPYPREPGDDTDAIAADENSDDLPF